MPASIGNLVGVVHLKVPKVQTWKFQTHYNAFVIHFSNEHRTVQKVSASDYVRSQT